MLSSRVDGKHVSKGFFFKKTFKIPNTMLMASGDAKSMPPAGGAFKAYDISDPSNPTLMEYIQPGDGEWGFDVDIYDNIGYTTFYMQTPAILDLSDPYNIQVLGHMPQNSSAIKVYGKHLFLCPSIFYPSDALKICGLTDPRQPNLELLFPASIGYTTSIDIINGMLYASESSPGKVTLIDIGGFDYPESLGCFSVRAIISGEGFWLPQVAVNGRMAYYAAGDSGLYVLRYTGPMPINTADANGSGDVNGIDVIYLANYFKYGGNPPAPPRERGDANGDCIFNGLDETYLVNYLKDGPEPIRGFCYGH